MSNESKVVNMYVNTYTDICIDTHTSRYVEIAYISKFLDGGVSSIN